MTGIVPTLGSSPPHPLLTELLESVQGEGVGQDIRDVTAGTNARAGRTGQSTMTRVTRMITATSADPVPGDPGRTRFLRRRGRPRRLSHVLHRIPTGLHPTRSANGSRVATGLHPTKIGKGGARARRRRERRSGGRRKRSPGVWKRRRGWWRGPRSGRLAFLESRSQLPPASVRLPKQGLLLQQASPRPEFVWQFRTGQERKPNRLRMRNRGMRRRGAGSGGPARLG